MLKVHNPLLLLLCLLLSLNGMAQVQAAVRMVWMDVGHSAKAEHQHAFAEEHRAAMSCCDEDDSSSSSQKASPCPSSHLCCTVVAVLPSMIPAVAVGMRAAPPTYSNLQPLPLAALSFWRPPRA